MVFAWRTGAFRFACRPRTARQSGSPPSAYDATRLLFRDDVASHRFCIVCIDQVFAITPSWPRLATLVVLKRLRLVQTRTISTCGASSGSEGVANISVRL